MKYKFCKVGKLLFILYLYHCTIFEQDNMFTDKSFEPVGFEPQISNEKTQKAANIQTENVVYESEEVQVIETKNIETQTVNKTVKVPQYNYDKLATFLKRVTPGVMQFLDEQYGSSAFNDYNLSGTGEPCTNIHLVNRLNNLVMSDFKEKISDVTWSAGGGTLAVSHSATYHVTWCDDLTKIEFYNLSKDDQLISTPCKTLEVPSCVTSLVYHPEEPSIIVAGLFNGDVLVWNLRDESSVTPLQVCVHGDLVSQVQWHLKIFNGFSSLITSSAEGYIFIHKLTVNFTQSTLSKQYKIAKEMARPQSASGSRERASEAGLPITCFDFSSKDHSLLVVGTLCGGLYKCRIDNDISIQGDENIFDPVVDEYDRHKGSVTCVKSAPIQNLFVSCASDKEIRIYNFDQPASLKVIIVENTVVQLTWHFGNQNIFLAYGAGSEVKFFNVNNGRPLTKMMLYSESRENTSCLNFNPKREMVAIGDTRGNLEIWKIPRNLIP
ncbi:PREDICTED: WD repeat-containing protein 34-like [Ceratosolen solmsi marchali]|uniref:WD repeat-containing protein 34-like n=1 Tax=Ceratosolen solmsi marchali TaxID=326594 RepID=A0AAJ6YJH5_9HYME|nr:PREDICTED: WD repeat-containing protein 34-like [Ceratosolen solmsi marchali]